MESWGDKIQEELLSWFFLMFYFLKLCGVCTQVFVLSLFLYFEMSYEYDFVCIQPLKMQI